MTWAYLLGLIVALVVVWFVFHYVTKWIAKDMTEGDSKKTTLKWMARARSLAFTVLILIFGIWIVGVAGFNLISRSDINHQSIDQQNQQYEQSVTK